MTRIFSTEYNTLLIGHWAFFEKMEAINYERENIWGSSVFMMRIMRSTTFEFLNVISKLISPSRYQRCHEPEVKPWPRRQLTWLWLTDHAPPVGAVKKLKEYFQNVLLSMSRMVTSCGQFYPWYMTYHFYTSLLTWLGILIHNDPKNLNITVVPNHDGL